MPETHVVKCWPEFYDAVERGEMNFQIRKNDRNYRVGDILHIRRYDDRTAKYTGPELKRRITFVMTSTGPGSITPLHGLSQGFAILSLANLP